MERPRFTTFPEHNGHPEQNSVTGVYERTYQHIPTPRSEVYVSTPLTSGGARRLFITMTDGSLSITEIISNTVQRNRHFVDTVIEEAETLFPEERITLPHRIGMRDGWGEVDYNRYWMYYLSGIRPDYAQTFEDVFSSNGIVDRTVFDNHAGERDRRLEEYKRLLQGFTRFIREEGMPINPVSGIALMPDHQYSLGCSLERELGQFLGIPMREIYFDRNHPRFGNHVSQVAEWLLMDYGELQSPTVDGDGRNIIIFRAY